MIAAGLALAGTATATAGPGHGAGSHRAGTAVTIGLLSTNPALTASCTGTTVVQSATAVPGQYVVPAGGGVVTSWSTNARAAGTGPARALFFVPTGGSGFTLVGKAPLVPLTPSVLNTFPVRIPVPAGALLGVQYTGTGACADPSPSNTINFGIFDPDSGTVANLGSSGNYTINIAATVEPDVDGDGFGDVSQDLCPQSASVQAAACPAPDTTVKKPRLVGRNKVKFTFRSSIPGSTFVCAIDSNQFLPCKSGFRKKFSFGKHVIQVAAVSPQGIVDPTPFKGKFKLVRR